MAGKAIEIDRASLLELARGANLYRGKQAALRELLSNAADATLLRLFAERGAAAFPTNDDSLHALRAALAAYPIDVTIEPLAPVGRKEHVRVRIRDRGTGIGEADLPFLGTLGASSKNPKRRALIEAMPEWMRPTGAFGIGLHSAFLAADELILRTRHAETGQARTLRLATCAEGVELEEIDGELLEDAGTEAVIVIPDDGTFSADAIRRAGASGWEPSDPLLDPLPLLHLHRLGLRVAVREECAAGLVPTRVDGELVPSRFDPVHAAFDPETLVELAWSESSAAFGPFWDARAVDVEARPQLFYRSHLLPHQSPGGYLTAVHVNAHWATARDTLVVSRDSFTYAGQQELYRRRFEAMKRVGPRWLQGKTAGRVPASLEPWISRELWCAEVAEPDEHWRRAEVCRRDSVVLTLGDVAAAGRVERIKASARTDRYTVGAVSVELMSHSEPVFRDLRRLFGTARLIAVGANSWESTETWERGRWGATRDAFAALLSFAASRAVAPCPDGYDALGLDFVLVDRQLGEQASQLRDVAHGPFGFFLLLPYYFVESRIEAPGIVRWVELTATCARGGARDPKEIAALGWRFLVDFDPDVRAIPGRDVRYDLEALRAELSAAFGALPSIDEVRASLTQ